MSKHKHLKKKPTSHKSTSHHNKIQNNHKRNQYIQALKRIAAACNAPEALDLLPDNEFPMLWMLRFGPLQVIPEGDLPIDRKIIREMTDTIHFLLRTTTFTLENPNIKINYFTYLTAGQGLYFTIKRFKPDRFPGADLLLKKFAPFFHFYDKVKTVEISLFAMAIVLAASHSNLENRVYSSRVSIEWGNPPNLNTHFTVAVTCHIPKKITITIDGKSRPAHQVIWHTILNGFINLTVSADKLPNYLTNDKSKTFDIYIQSHALKRLRERVDSYKDFIVQQFLAHSLTLFDTVVTKSGQTLIKFYFEMYHIGYLTFDIIDNILCIRTFLFLTNQGTPEGEKLHSILGLNRLDISYLAIDKISTFIDTDVSENDTLKKIFAKAGCKSLFCLKQYVVDKSSWLNHASAIIKYLGVTDGDQERSDFW